MLKKSYWLFILPVLVIVSSCGAPTSVSSSVSCSGYMLVENNRYKKALSKKREHQTRSNLKAYHRNKGKY